MFDTADGRGSDIVRLVPDANGDELRAWTLLTTLEELKGHEERVGKMRPAGVSVARDFRDPNWFDVRRAAAAYADRDPRCWSSVAGRPVTIAARLGQLGIDTLIQEPSITSTRGLVRDLP